MPTIRGNPSTGCLTPWTRSSEAYHCRDRTYCNGTWRSDDVESCQISEGRALEDQMDATGRCPRVARACNPICVPGRLLDGSTADAADLLAVDASHAYRLGRVAGRHLGEKPNTRVGEGLLSRQGEARRRIAIFASLLAVMGVFTIGSWVAHGRRGSWIMTKVAQTERSEVGHARTKRGCEAGV